MRRTTMMMMVGGRSYQGMHIIEDYMFVEPVLF